MSEGRFSYVVGHMVVLILLPHWKSTLLSTTGH